jgi:response regulator NasT
MLIEDRRDGDASLRHALAHAGCELVAKVAATDDVVARARQLGPDVIVMNTGLPGRDALERVRTSMRDFPRPVVVIAEGGDRATIRTAIEIGVSAYVVGGYSEGRLRPMLDVAIARFECYQALRDELDKTRASLAERKTIERAKGVLMQRRSLPENEAYQTLRRMAMDRGKRLVEVAETIVSAEEMLARG